MIENAQEEFFEQFHIKFNKIILTSRKIYIKKYL